MTTTEPELITIIEGPTPEFQITPQEWVQSLYEGAEDRIVANCQLRTANGPDIVARCRKAWDEQRSVKLDFPDELRMRQQVDVMSLRLSEIDEGQVLNIWVALPVEFVQAIEDDDQFDDDSDEDDEDNMFFS
jgi:hypothetical protein